MDIRRKISESPVALFIKMLPTKLKECRDFAYHNARAYNSSRRSNSLSDILMLTHALEKSYSLPERRKVFGRGKAIDLIGKLHTYIRHFGYDTSLDVPLALIATYMAEQRSAAGDQADWQKLESDYENLLPLLPGAPDPTLAGTMTLTKEEALRSGRGNYQELVRGRYSIRDFSGENIPDSLIRDALDIARKSPGACNRQAYRVHVFRGEDKERLMLMQQGSKAFRENASAVILISADMNRYYTRESNLGYVDASLFAMTLIYAFSYLGIASIPLTLGLEYSLVSRIKSTFGIPANEMPVMMIAVGGFKDKTEVALSHRNPVESFTTFHK